MNKKQQGFGVIELLCVLILMTVIVGIGWIVLKRNSTSPQSNLSTAANQEKETAKQQHKLPRGWELVTTATLKMKIDDGSADNAVMYTIPSELIGKLAFNDDTTQDYVPGIARTEYLLDNECLELWSDTSSINGVFDYYGPGLRIYSYTGDFTFKDDTQNLDSRYVTGRAADGNYFVLPSSADRIYKVGDAFFISEYEDVQDLPETSKQTTCYEKYKSQIMTDKPLFQQIERSIR